MKEPVLLLCDRMKAEVFVMIVYDGIKSEFLNSVMNGTIAEEVRQRIFEKMGRTTPKSEFDSWKNSLSRMYMVLADTSIPDHAGIAIEYNVPQTSKRVDFIVSGYDADNQSNAVIIELKQWDELKKVDGKDALVETYTGGGLREVVHPCYQVWSYATLIRDYIKQYRIRILFYLLVHIFIIML